jgi:2-amino-4-hydroxy-6-hydroxymethyldihydropteridine diphosphokinase
MKNRAYLSLGSNIDHEKNITAALALLAEPGRLLAISTIWETEPVGFTQQPNFLNGAALVETALSAAAFKDRVLRQIEDDLGRVRVAGNKNAPRTIDLDLLLFNEEILEIDGQEIPSPEVLARSFVAIPLAEIAPDYIHPLTGETLSEIARRFADKTTLMRRRDDLTAGLLIYLQSA